MRRTFSRSIWTDLQQVPGREILSEIPVSSPAAPSLQCTQDQTCALTDALSRLDLNTTFQQAPHSEAGPAATSIQDQRLPISNESEKLKNARIYLEQVRVEFQDKPQVFQQFLDMLRSYNNGEIDVQGIVLLVRMLFDGHPELVRRFEMR
jgi:histone deacetylase complex regulatory component SIN3